jgi:hypothetical protein
LGKGLKPRDMNVLLIEVSQTGTIHAHEISLMGRSASKQGRDMGHTCNQLHLLFHCLPMHAFPFDEETIPLNGVYILFEKGETGHGTDRIVRIGAHTGVDQLRSRLMQHFMLENKDRSIFRKNIGRAILNRDHDPFLKQWELDLTSHEAKEKYQNKIDLKKQALVEKDVSQTI